MKMLGIVAVCSTVFTEAMLTTDGVTRSATPANALESESAN